MDFINALDYKVPKPKYSKPYFLSINGFEIDSEEIAYISFSTYGKHSVTLFVTKGIGNIFKNITHEGNLEIIAESRCEDSIFRCTCYGIYDHCNWTGDLIEFNYYSSGDNIGKIEEINGSE